MLPLISSGLGVSNNLNPGKPTNNLIVDLESV